jgi:hypothetical protein
MLNLSSDDPEQCYITRLEKKTGWECPWNQYHQPYGLCTRLYILDCYHLLLVTGRRRRRRFSPHAEERGRWWNMTRNEHLQRMAQINNIAIVKGIEFPWPFLKFWNMTACVNCGLFAPQVLKERPFLQWGGCTHAAAAAAIKTTSQINQFCLFNLNTLKLRGSSLCKCFISLSTLCFLP